MQFYHRAFYFLVFFHLLTRGIEVNAQNTCLCRQVAESTCLDITSSSSPLFSPVICIARSVSCSDRWVCDIAGTTVCDVQNVTSYRITGGPLPYNYFVNGGFEEPVIPANSFRTFSADIVPGWSTTATDNRIEFWSSGFAGQPSYQGNQFVELNANQVASLYQEIQIIPAGLPLNFSFAHAARGTTGTFDVMALTITDLGFDQIYGTADDTMLFQKIYNAPIDSSVNANVWTVHTARTEPTILSLGNTTRFSYDSISSGSGQPTIGNFLDAVSYGLEVPDGYDVYECNSQDVIHAVPQ